MSTLLCFSQNFVNDLHEKNPTARLEAIAHPTGGYRLIVSHQIEEENLEVMKQNFPDLQVMATVPDGQNPEHLYFEQAAIHYRPLAEWQKRLQINAVSTVRRETMRIVAKNEHSSRDYMNVALKRTRKLDLSA